MPQSDITIKERTDFAKAYMEAEAMRDLLRKLKRAHMEPRDVHLTDYYLKQINRFLK